MKFLCTSTFMNLFFIILLLNDVQSKSLNSYADKLQQSIDLINRLKDATNQRDNVPSSDDHPSDWKPELMGVVELGENDKWNMDDDHESSVCTQQSMAEEESHKTQCLRVFTDIYDLAKGYEAEAVDVTLSSATVETLRKKRGVIAVKDVIADGNASNTIFVDAGPSTTTVTTTPTTVSIATSDTVTPPTTTTSLLTTSSVAAALVAASLSLGLTQSSTLASSTTKKVVSENIIDSGTNNVGSDDEVNPFMLVEPGASRPTRDPNKMPANFRNLLTHATTSATIINQHPFVKSSNADEDNENLISRFQLTEPPTGNNPPTTTGTTTSSGQVQSSSSSKPSVVDQPPPVGPQVVVDNNGKHEPGAWITDWKPVVYGALPGFHPDAEYSETEKLIRRNICIRMATLPYIRDKCCVTVSLVCTEYMQAQSVDEGEHVQVKNVVNSQTTPDEDHNTLQNHNNLEFGTDDNNNNNNNGGRLRFRDLLGSAIQGLATLLSDMIKNSN